jgi:hypothetical protein
MKTAKQSEFPHKWTAEDCPHLALFFLTGEPHKISRSEARAELKKELEKLSRAEIEKLALRIANFQGGVAFESIFGEIRDYLLALQVEVEIVDPAPDPNPEAELV